MIKEVEHFLKPIKRVWKWNTYILFKKALRLRFVLSQADKVNAYLTKFFEVMKRKFWSFEVWI